MEISKQLSSERVSQKKQKHIQYMNRLSQEQYLLELSEPSWDLMEDISNPLDLKAAERSNTKPLWPVDIKG